jgi:hypothetical protein
MWSCTVLRVGKGSRLRLHESGRAYTHDPGCAISLAKAERFCLMQPVWLKPNVHAAWQTIPTFE